MSYSSLDPYRDILGVQFDAERLTENLAAFHDILREIQKLRQLDLTDVSPALVFEPTAPYRTGGAK
jgi:putative NADH-flavin reductase